MRLLLAIIVVLNAGVAIASVCDDEAEVALRFMNAYAQYTGDRIAKKTNMSTKDWLRLIRTVTPRFRSLFEATEREGLKRDPELGWDVDLIVDAQDLPDRGFGLHSCKGSGLVELQGEDWPEFRVVVKVVRSRGTLLVDGSGRVNVPVWQRAKR